MIDTDEDASREEEAPEDVPACPEADRRSTRSPSKIHLITHRTLCYAKVYKLKRGLLSDSQQLFPTEALRIWLRRDEFASS